MPVAVLSNFVSAIYQLVEGKKASHGNVSLPQASVYLNKEMVF